MKRIELLLDKYFLGQTDLEEERELQNYFLSSEVEEEFRKYKTLFVLFEQERSAEQSFQFEEPAPRRNFRPLFWLSGVAAAAVLAVFLILPNKFSQDTFIVVRGEKNYNQELAVQHADQKLNFIAQQLAAALEPIRKSEENIENSLKPMRQAEEAFEILSKY